MKLSRIDQQLIKLALEEDLTSDWCDITTQYLFDESYQTHAHIISKHAEPIIVCGEAVVKEIVRLCPEKINYEMNIRDGQVANPKDTILTLSGSALSLLKVERTILNFMQRLSAIATLTKQFVNAIEHTDTKILDTRKTAPGMRHLEKYAVHCGGGVNHRMGLYDAVMVKDTHIDALGGMPQALAKIPEDLHKSTPVIIEVRTLGELEWLLANASQKISRVLLDNMTLDELEASVKLCKNVLPTEASGNISLQTVKAIAETGVDFASVGGITHSAKAVDLSMKNI